MVLPHRAKEETVFLIAGCSSLRIGTSLREHVPLLIQDMDCLPSTADVMPYLTQDNRNRSRHASSLHHPPQPLGSVLVPGQWYAAPEGGTGQSGPRWVTEDRSLLQESEALVLRMAW